MTALAADRQKYQSRVWRGPTASYPVAASTKIYHGGMVALNASGYLVPGSNTAGLAVVGVAEETVDNTSGADGALRCKVSTGMYKFENSGTKAVEQGDAGRPIFVEDDQTVADETTKGIVAGLLVEVETDGVTLLIFPGLSCGIERGIETVTSGAVSPHTRTSLISVTGTQAYTLANGIVEGQRKNLIVTVAASTPDGTLTPTTFANGTSIDLDAVLESVELEWHFTGGWRVVQIVGATINA